MDNDKAYFKMFIMMVSIIGWLVFTTHSLLLTLIDQISINRHREHFKNQPNFTKIILIACCVCCQYFFHLFFSVVVLVVVVVQC